MSVHKTKTAYVVRWREAGRKQSRSFDKRDDALAFDGECRRRRQMGAHAPSAPSRETLGEFIVAWWERESVTWAASTRAERSYRIDKWITPYLRDVRLVDLGVERVADWRAQIMRDGASANTANAVRRILSAILGAAERIGKLGSATNPVERVSVVKRDAEPERRALTVAQIERVRAAMTNPRDRALVSLMAYAGLRPEEALALRWRDVSDRTLRVERAFTHGELRKPKAHSRRTIKLAPALADDLALWRERTPGGEPDDLVVPALGRADRPRYGVDLSSAFLNLNNWRNRAWARALAIADVKAAPYDLRHSFASLRFAAGATISDVMALMGHDAPTTTERYYLHAYEDSKLDDARLDLDESIARERTSASPVVEHALA